MRAAADARYQAFVSTGGAAPPDSCSNFGAPDHDYDRCVGDLVQNPVLFHKQDGDVDAVDPQDVRQDGLGDCQVLAPLAALASSPRGRAFLRGAVVENRNDAGVVQSWTVTLHQRETHWLGGTTFREVHITVAGLYAFGHAIPRPAGSQNEIWPLVMEKAYAQLAGGYNKMGRGGEPSVAMSLLTGHEAQRVSLAWYSRWYRSYGADKLQGDLAKGKMVVFTTRDGIGGELSANPTPGERQANVHAHGLIESHAYFAMGTEQHDGKLFARLGNPWGKTEPELVPCDELTTWFSEVTVGSVP